MTQEEDYPRIDEEILTPPEDQQDTDESFDDVVFRKDRNRVKDMILRFERSAIISTSSLSNSNESLPRHRQLSMGGYSTNISPFNSHSQNRVSSISINSVLSNASEGSIESTSSGFVSDRKSCADCPVPHRPAPPPPKLDNVEMKFSKPRDRRYSFSTPQTSPVLPRRARQPPVIRRKSLAGSQGHLGDTHWSYGVTQTDLEKLLRLKRSEVSDNEEVEESVNSQNIGDSDDSDDSDKTDEEDVGHDDTKVETMSTDRSTDTLINDEGGSGEGDNSSLTSEVSGSRSNYDNVSIKSISSFDMVPYQKYDSITVSSDEFGSEVCHAPDTEFLTVSAVNEWCVTNSVEQVLLPVETKKEKYRR